MEYVCGCYWGPKNLLLWSIYWIANPPDFCPSQDRSVSDKNQENAKMSSKIVRIRVKVKIIDYTQDFKGIQNNKRALKAINAPTKMSHPKRLGCISVVLSSPCNLEATPSIWAEDYTTIALQESTQSTRWIASCNFGKFHKPRLAKNMKRWNGTGLFER